MKFVIVILASIALAVGAYVYTLLANIAKIAMYIITIS